MIIHFLLILVRNLILIVIVMRSTGIILLIFVSRNSLLGATVSDYERIIITKKLMVVHAILSKPLLNSRSPLHMLLRILRIAHHMMRLIRRHTLRVLIWSLKARCSIASIPWWWSRMLAFSSVMTLILAVLGVAIWLLSRRWTIIVGPGAFSTSSCDVLINSVVSFSLVLSMDVLWSRAWPSRTTRLIYWIRAYLLLGANLMSVWGGILILRIVGSCLFLTSWGVGMSLMLIIMMSRIRLRRKLARLLLSIVANLSWAVAVVGIVGMVGILAAWMLWLLVFIIFSYQIVIAWRVTSSIKLLLVFQLLLFTGINRLVASHWILEWSNPSSGDLVGVGRPSWTNSIWTTVLRNLTVITCLFLIRK